MQIVYRFQIYPTHEQEKKMFYTLKLCRKFYLAAEARTVNSQLLLKIENAYNGRLNLQDGDYYSTKSGEFHGIGMQNIKKVVEACGGFVKTQHSGKVFTLMAAFPNPCAAEESRSGNPPDSSMRIS